MLRKDSQSNLRRCPMGWYAGCDLHAKSNYWGMVDGEGKRVFKKKVGNDGERILEMLERFRGELEGTSQCPEWAGRPWHPQNGCIGPPGR
jgi:hypothetical protein